MLGGYTVVTAANAGINIWISMLVLAPLVVGCIGVAVERLLIRFLYGRTVDTLLATWGLSLFPGRHYHRYLRPSNSDPLCRRLSAPLRSAITARAVMKSF